MNAPLKRRVERLERDSGFQDGTPRPWIRLIVDGRDDEPAAQLQTLNEQGFNVIVRRVVDPSEPPRF